MIELRDLNDVQAVRDAIRELLAGMQTLASDLRETRSKLNELLGAIEAGKTDKVDFLEVK